MEVSGRKQAKDSKASAEVFQRFCEPCDGEGEHIVAEGYCQQCREYLCKPCIKFHRRNKQSKLHDVLEGDNMPTTRRPTSLEESTLSEICPIHSKTKEPIKFYCPTHDDIGCGDCIVLTHRTCRVDYIADVAKGFKESGEYKDILASIKSLEQRIKDCEDAMKETSRSNTVVQQTALDSIQTFRTEILDYLDKREQELVTAINTMKAEDDKLLADIRAQREDAKKKLEEIKLKIQISNDEAKQLFMLIKRRKSDLKALKKVLEDSTEQIKSRRRRYQFGRDEVIEDMILSKRPLGTLDSSTVSTTLSLVKARCTPCTDINIRTSKDTSTCDITGIGLLTPNVLVLVDGNNYAVSIVDTTAKKVISRLQLSAEPYDLAILPDKQIAITMYGVQKIQILAVLNNTLSILRKLKVSGQCRGIDYKLGSMAVIYDDPVKVEIMDMNGVVTRVIHSNTTNKIRGTLSYVMFTSTGQDVLVTCKDDSVKKLSLQGNVLVSYRDTGLRYTRGIAVTGAGGILVCAEKSQTVHAVCEDNQKLKNLLSHRDGLNIPQCLCVSEKTGMLYVGCDENDVLKTFKFQQ